MQQTYFRWVYQFKTTPKTSKVTTGGQIRAKENCMAFIM